MNSSCLQACAIARPNIALVKYWGKRQTALNLPAAGSLSITLDSIYTRTQVRFDDTLTADQLLLNGQENPAALKRIRRFLDYLRQQAGRSLYAEVMTDNNFPTAAGLASSASGFAALALAASQALQQDTDAQKMSILARIGSGSAARSIYGGFVTMHAGQDDQGLEDYATPTFAAEHWPLSVVIAVTTTASKTVSSGTGMEQTRLTSPYHAAWIESVAEDIEQARRAIEQKDFMALAEVSEHSCLKMHADMLATRPPLMYWNAVTVACMQTIRALREEQGIPVFFTIDAGPQVKAICLPEVAQQVAQALAEVSGVVNIVHSGLGAGAELLEQRV